MKAKKLVLCLLLSVALVVTFIPMISFAEGEEPADADGTPAVEEPTVEEPVVEEADDSAVVQAKEQTSKAGWTASAVDDEVYLNGSSQTLEVRITGTAPASGLIYMWEWYDRGSSTGTVISGATSNTLSVSKAGYYVCTVVEDDEDGYNEQDVNFTVYDHDSWLTVYVNGVNYELNSYYDVDGAGVYGYDSSASLPSSISILSSVTLSNGKAYPVTVLATGFPETVKSVAIPASVQSIDSDLGYYDDGVNWVPIPGFTIFGTTGSVAHSYAIAKGFAFRDLAAEAEAARQGVYSASMPAAKASKPKAAKKSITVKWKKLKKKQLKSGVSNIEVWVSTNTAFATGATIEKKVGKKKASVKIKGLQKGVTYYAKVRTIKYVGGQKIVGKWSAVKKVKVKK